MNAKANGPDKGKRKRHAFNSSNDRAHNTEMTSNLNVCKCTPKHTHASTKVNISTNTLTI